MAGGMFLIQTDGSLLAMNERPYDSEEVLQVLLARYPDLLAGDQMGSAEPRRWLLISRETPIPVEAGGGWQFSCDHLFLDQDAVPTLVEVKRAVDTRTRREVVAQMLDYAANANAYGPVKPLAEQFEERCQAEGLDALAEIASRLGPDIEPLELWERADTNLSAGRMRLVFVADVIPPELRRIVEFLNTQMRETEVLAVEIRQYVGEDLKTLVPRVLGQTEEARARKQTARMGREWDEDSFFAALQQQAPSAVPVARRIYGWAREHMPDSEFGRGAKDGAFNLRFDRGDISYAPLSIWTYDRLNFQFEYLSNKPPFDRIEMRLELLRRFNEMPGVDLKESVAGELPLRPSVRLSRLDGEAACEKLFAALEWFLDVARRQEGREGK